MQNFVCVYMMIYVIFTHILAINNCKMKYKNVIFMFRILRDKIRKVYNETSTLKTKCY